MAVRDLSKYFINSFQCRFLRCVPKRLGATPRQVATAMANIYNHLSQELHAIDTIEHLKVSHQ